MNIHKTAIINSKAEIGKNVQVGPYSIVEDDVVIEDDCEISSGALIASGTRIGKKCKIFHGAVLGSIPQDLKFAGEKTTLGRPAEKRPVRLAVRRPVTLPIMPGLDHSRENIKVRVAVTDHLQVIC